MTADLRQLCDDLLAETAALDDILAGLDDRAWDIMTPAEGFTVRDQITHLAFFDQAAIEAVVDPGGFERGKAEALADVDAFTGGIARAHAGMSGESVRAWFGLARAQFVEVFSALGPQVRVPWYGPDMSAASAITARIMETWAHGQDVADAVAVERRTTDRLRHVAHLGVRTLPNSFRARRRPVPDAPVWVNLRGPGGARWVWGQAGTENQVCGPALDFCLVVTQRRHVADTALSIQGSVAEEWMAIAQAFAGPPGPGRPRMGEAGGGS